MPELVRTMSTPAVLCFLDIHGAPAIQIGPYQDSQNIRGHVAGGVRRAATRDAGAAHAAVVNQQNPGGGPAAAVLCQQLVQLRGPAAQRACKACACAADMLRSRLGLKHTVPRPRSRGCAPMIMTTCGRSSMPLCRLHSQPTVLIQRSPVSRQQTTKVGWERRLLLYTPAFAVNLVVHINVIRACLPPQQGHRGWRKYPRAYVAGTPINTISPPGDALAN